MDLKGTLYKKMSREVINEKLTKLQFVIETTETYNDVEKKQYVLLESYNKTLQQVDAVKEGDKVAVNINLGGRKWQSPTGETKYFNTLVAWKISKQSEITNEQQQPDRGLDFDPPF